MTESETYLHQIEAHGGTIESIKSSDRYRYKQKSLASEETRLFPSGDPNRFVTVTEGHDAERARDSIMPRSAAT